MEKGNMTSQKESVKCSFCWRIYERESDSFVIAQYRDRTGKQFTALGIGLPQQKSLLVELFGEWGTNPKDGKKQFKADYYEICRQTDEEGIIAYLTSLHCGIGEKKARAIYAHFGNASWTIIQDEPERLREVRGVGASMANRIVETSRRAFGMRDVILLFNRANARITGWQASTFLKEHPLDPVGELKGNPYCACSVDGITFDKADALAESLGIPQNDPNRLKAYVSKLLNDAASRGHVCLPANELINLMTDKLGIDEEQAGDALERACADGLIHIDMGMVYTAKSFREETAIASEISRLVHAGADPITEIDPFIDAYERDNFVLAESQRNAVRTVFSSPVSIITGGPGTGKTTVIKAILSVHEAVYGEDSSPILLAPTGRAARRMTDATGHRAQTIHSAVGYRGSDAEADADVTLDGNLIIIDESSMMDQNIASALFSKCLSRSRIVLVGDPDQLPSVASGNILMDLIRSGCIPMTKLSVIFRQQEDNPIVFNAHAINKGRTDLLWSRTFKRMDCRDSEDIFKTAADFYIRCVRAYGMDNVILLNPQRNNTRLSVDAINKALQERLNPHRDGHLEMTIGRNVFRQGDRIMQMKNTEHAKNGDIGYIRDIVSVPSKSDPETKVLNVMIEFLGDTSRHVYSSDDMRSVDLGYCSTIHKAQGEEYSTVIMIVSRAHPSMLRRNLIYTGITRAKENCCIITEASLPGEPGALEIAIRNAGQDRRYTNLVERLKRELASP